MANHTQDFFAKIELGKSVAAGFGQRLRAASSSQFASLVWSLGTMLLLPSASQSAEPFGRWELKHVLVGHTSMIDGDGLAFSPDGRTLASSAAADRGVRLWDTTTGKTEAILAEPNQGGVTCVAFSPDGSLLAAGAGAKAGDIAQVWHVKKRTLIATVRGYEDSAPQHLAFSADGKTLACGCYREVVLWDVAARKELHVLKHEMGPVNGLAFSPDGKSLATGVLMEMNRVSELTKPAPVVVWDLATGKRRYMLTGHSSETLAVAYTPDGASLVTCSYTLPNGNREGEIWFWYANRPDAQVHKRLKNVGDACFDIAFSKKGDCLVTAGQQTVKVWDPATGDLRATIPLPPEHGLRCMALSADGKMIATGGNGKTIRVFHYVQK